MTKTGGTEEEQARRPGAGGRLLVQRSLGLGDQVAGEEEGERIYRG